ncbi:F-box only 48 [Pelobates cultripes]|nr:F-box only 48 [Pelobates cultripes]
MKRMSEQHKKQNNNNSYLDRMPPEILCHLLSYLELEDLVAIGKTCKFFNQTVQNTNTLWKKHCLAIAHVCQMDIKNDRRDGYPWKVTLQRNYLKSKVKKDWLDGEYSNIRSSTDLPKRSMHQMHAEDWGEILKVELER